jgi:hypothetical protein
MLDPKIAARRVSRLTDEDWRRLGELSGVELMIP